MIFLGPIFMWHFNFKKKPLSFQIDDAIDETSDNDSEVDISSVELEPKVFLSVKSKSG